jgi:hypothetical protein
MMRRLRKRQLKYGVTSGVFVFGVLWLIAALTMPQEPPGDLPRWKASLWLLLGIHFIEIVVDTGPFTTGTVDVTQLSEAPLDWLRIAPPVAVAGASFYAARKISQTRRLTYNLENAATVLVGYLPLLIIAFIISDANPQLETALTLVSIVAVAIYIGSAVLSKLTGRLPFFGVTSLGTILLVGLIAVAVAIEVVLAFAGALAAAAGGVTAGAVGAYYFSGGDGVLSFLRRHAAVLVLLVALSGGLYLTLGGPAPDAQLPSFNSSDGNTTAPNASDPDDTNGEGGQINLSSASGGIDEAVVETKILERINSERRQRGLSTLTHSGRLTDPARAHAAGNGPITRPHR